MLVPIPFSILLIDMFLVINDVKFMRYADDNTIYDSGDTIDKVIKSLQISGKIILEWFSDNQMKGNSDKCHFIASNDETHQIVVGNFPIGSSSWEKLLGIKIYLKLTFYDHVQDMQGSENTKSIIQRNTIHENGKKKSFSYLFFQLTV